MTAELAGPPLLFLDLDGTVRWGHDELVAAGAPNEWVNGPDDVVVFPEAVTMMARWRSTGGRIFGITNQAGVALGHMTEETCGLALRRTNDATGRLFDEVAVCVHAPDAGCWCRKPLPGMIFDAVLTATEEWGRTSRDKCLMVGDRPEDEQAAAAAGVPFRWAADWRAEATA